jgi:glycerol-3-phosphate dehydrogenase
MTTDPRAFRSPGLGHRDTNLERLAASPRDPFDLLVVGGGVTGAGIALDAAAGGMRVALVDKGDFASGTSSKSSKLAHGGLRYLEHRDLGLVREASLERDLLRRLAPHLIEPVPFVIPVMSRRERVKLGTGLWLYDALAAFRNLRPHRRVDADEVAALFPALRAQRVRSGFVYFDSQTDDVRLVLELLVQAAARGAVVVNYARVVALDGSPTGCRATVRDEESGSETEVAARHIAIAGGVWSDRIASLAPDGDVHRLRPSKGVHLVFPRSAIPTGAAAGLIPDVEGKRMLFVIPWLDSVLVGTTDTPYDGPLDDVRVESQDRAYCLDAVNAMLGLQLGERDIAGAFAGLRPLVHGEAEGTDDLSRRHLTWQVAPGITGVTGGKLTTYRRMAKDVVDRIASTLGVTAPCRTTSLRLGTAGRSVLTDVVARRAARLGITPEAVPELVRSYGDRALQVLDVAAAEDLVAPLARGHARIAAEAAYAARCEMVVHLEDLLARRTRLSLTDPAAGIGPGSHAAVILGAELGWDETRSNEEVGRHRERVERERGLPLGEELPQPDVTLLA